MWIQKLVFWFTMAAVLWGLASAHAADKPPTPLRVAHELGYRLAVDPRVTYPPDDVNCWWPATDRYQFECDAYNKNVTKKWWTERDSVYGVKVKRWEDGSWAITKYTLIGIQSSLTSRP